MRALACIVVLLIVGNVAQAAQKPRVVVTTDPELDDANSLIRYLLYSTDFRNPVTVRWWQWREVGTYPGKVTVANSTSLEASMQVPSDAAPGQTIHVVGEATGKGAPPLTRYQRLVIVVAR